MKKLSGENAGVAVNVSFLSLGELDGKKVLDAEGGAFKVTREVILLRATELGHDLGMDGDKLHIQARDWLDGYGKILGKVRKSEVLAVFLASCIGMKELVIGTRKGNPEAGEDATKEYVNKETHDGLEWLNACTDYATLIKRARDVRGKSGTGTNVVRIALSDKALDKVQDALGSASASQAAVIAQAAYSKMQQDPSSDKMFLSTMLGICIRLDHSKDPEIKSYVRGVASGAQELIGKITRDELAVGVVKPPMAPAMIQSPEPEVPQAAAA